MDREVFVHVDLEGTPHLVGRLWTRLRKDSETVPMAQLLNELRDRE